MTSASTGDRARSTRARIPPRGGARPIWICCSARGWFHRRHPQVLGDRWSALIIRELFYGTARFEEFLQHLGIATNILSQRLQHLVDHGIIEKQAYQTRPPRYEYRLTAKGLDLYPVPLSMLAWGTGGWRRGSHPFD